MIMQKRVKIVMRIQLNYKMLHLRYLAAVKKIHFYTKYTFCDLGEIAL